MTYGRWLTWLVAAMAAIGAIAGGAPRAMGEDSALPATGESATTATTEGGLEIPDAPPPTTVAPATGKLVQADWYLVTCEANKVGYVNLALYRVEDEGPVAWRLEVRRFLNVTATDPRPSFLEESVMEMDKDFTAVRFHGSHRRGFDRVEIEGRVADGQLHASVSQGIKRRSWSTPVAGQPTFDGAFLLWFGREKLGDANGAARTVIDERDGTFRDTPRQARSLRRGEITLGPTGKRTEVYLVAEQSGTMLMADVFTPEGRLVRSDARNANLVVQEASATDGMRLKLEGQVTWQNMIAEQTGDSYASSTFGYKVKLPAYPYVPVSIGEGKFLAIDSLLGGDSLHVLVLPATLGDTAAQRQKLFEQWGALLGPTSEVDQSATRIDKIDATVYTGKVAISGRPADFKLAVAVRGDVGYLFGSLRFWPEPATDAMADLLASVRWTKIFGRERGHWDGADYVSDSFAYRLKLLAPGWRLPEERSGVATAIEAAREDRSAVITVSVEARPAGADLKKIAADYTERIRTRFPDASALAAEPMKLGGEPAVAIRYRDKAIDSEPTQSEHILTLHGDQVYNLTFVSTVAGLNANRPHFAEAMESFRFEAPHASTKTDD